MKKRKFLTLALTALMAMQCVLTSCSSKKDDGTVTLKWYIGGSEQADLKEVNDKLNEYTREKIGAEVEIIQLDWSAYDQKMNMLISTKSEFDLCWTSPQRNNYYTNIDKNAFLPLNDLIKQYAPKTYAGVPEDIWEAARVKGEIYGIINYQVMATAYGFAVQREIADKAGFDWANVNNYKDIEPVLKYVKENYPTYVPIGISKASNPFTGALPMFGLEAVGGTKEIGAVYTKTDDYKVVNQYETPEFMDYIKQMRDWYQKGYIKQDAPTTSDDTTDRVAGKIAVLFPEYLLNDTTVSDYYPDQPYGTTGKTYYLKRLTMPYLSNDRALATMTAISSTSKHPEKAMEFIELVNTDEEVYNLLCWGIEGKHWNRTDYMSPEGYHVTVDQVEDSGYKPNAPWKFGNNANLWLGKTNASAEFWESENEKADKSPLLGFSYDASNTTSETANCASVCDEYLNALICGSVDIDTVYPQFIDKLKVAGADKIVAEKQKQIDEWLKTK